MNLENRFDRTRCRGVGALLTGALLLGSVSPVFGEPARDAIRVYLSRELPSYFELSEFEFRNFEGANEGTGRTSAAGELILKSDIFKWSRDALSTELNSRGFNRSEIGYYTRLLGKGRTSRNIYTMTHDAGATFPFVAEIQFRETINGYRFFGEPRYRKPDGEPRSELPSKAVIAGTAAFNKLVKEYADAKKRVEALKERARKEIDTALSGTTITYMRSESGIDDKFFILKTNDAVRWTTVRNRANQLAFGVDGNSRWLQKGRWANSRYESGARVPMRIEGTVTVTPGKTVKEWSASLVVSVPKESGDGFYSTGGTYKWDGKAFIASAIYVRGKLVPEVSNVENEGGVARVPFSRLPDGYKMEWKTGTEFKFKTRNDIFDDPENDNIVTIRLVSLEVEKGEIVLKIKLRNDNPEPNYLIFLTTNSDERYGEKLYITDNYKKKKFYAKNGIEGDGKIDSFNSKANAYYIQPGSTELVKLRFPMVTPGADEISLYSRRVHGHQSGWSIKRLASVRKDSEKPKKKAKMKEGRDDDTEDETMSLDQAISAYIPVIRQKISRNWHRPDNVSGRVSANVRVKLTKEGEVVSAKIVKSSGDDVFDESVRAAAMNASPLPIPREASLNKEFRSITLRFEP